MECRIVETGIDMQVTRMSLTRGGLVQPDMSCVQMPGDLQRTKVLFAFSTVMQNYLKLLASSLGILKTNDRFNAVTNSDYISSDHTVTQLSPRAGATQRSNACLHDQTGVREQLAPEARNLLGLGFTACDRSAPTWARGSRMRNLGALHALISVALGAVLLAGAVGTAQAQETAADAALNMANMLDGAGGGVSNDAAIAALEDAAEAGQPMALWQLGNMYETGEGVHKDPVKAFGYFSQIADNYFDSAPRGMEADIVAQSMVKVGEYYRTGLPDAGVRASDAEYERRIQHAASYFGDADAQYRLGELYLDEEGLGDIPVLSSRWLRLAATKGHGPAQAKLGDMLFNGTGIESSPVEGLMWLMLARQRVAGTGDAAWVNELADRAMSVATPDQRKEASGLVQSVGAQFARL